MRREEGSSGACAPGDVQTRRRQVPPRSERALERGTRSTRARPASSSSSSGAVRARMHAALRRWAALLLAALVLLVLAACLLARLRTAHVLRTPLERALRVPTATTATEEEAPDTLPLAAVLGARGSAAAAAAERARAAAVRAAVREGRWLTARPYTAAALQRVRTAVLGPRAAADAVAASHLWLFDRADYVLTDTHRSSSSSEGRVVVPVPRHDTRTYTRHTPARGTHALAALLRAVCADSAAGAARPWLLLLGPHAFVAAPHLVRLVHALDSAGLAAEPLVLGNTALGTLGEETAVEGAVGEGVEGAGTGVLDVARGALLSPAAVEGVCGAAKRDPLLRAVEPRDDAGLVLTVLARAAGAAVVHAPALFPGHGPRARAAFAAVRDTAVVVPALSTDAVFNAGVLAHEYFRVHEQAPTCNMPVPGDPAGADDAQDALGDDQ